jgi:hypothetical protein
VVDANLAGIDIDHRSYSQAFRTVYVVGFGGNDHVEMDRSLSIPAVVSEGNGNDHVQAGDGNNSILLGDGNDHVELGNGNNVVAVGTGKDEVHLVGGGKNLVVGDLDDDHIQAARGRTNTVDRSQPYPGSGQSIARKLAGLQAGGVTSLDNIRASLKVLYDFYGPR